MSEEFAVNAAMEKKLLASGEAVLPHISGKDRERLQVLMDTLSAHHSLTGEELRKLLSLLAALRLMMEEQEQDRVKKLEETLSPNAPETGQEKAEEPTSPLSLHRVLWLEEVAKMENMLHYMQRTNRPSGMSLGIKWKR